jgi:hypothetical protein
VNTNTPYEQLMAFKLEQVPVPDMSDRIWADIETQLDADRSVPTPKGKGLWYGIIGIVTLVTLVLIWWYYGHKSNAPGRTVPKTSTPLTKEPLPATDSHTIINKPGKRILPAEIVPFGKDTLLPINSSVDSTFRPDFLPARLDVFPFRGDSSSGQNNGTQLYIDTVKISPPVRKHSGVRGITDDDYKISAKKDSGKSRD